MQPVWSGQHLSWSPFSYITRRNNKRTVYPHGSRCYSSTLFANHLSSSTSTSIFKWSWRALYFPIFILCIRGTILSSCPSRRIFHLPRQCLSPNGPRNATAPKILFMFSFRLTRKLARTFSVPFEILNSNFRHIFHPCTFLQAHTNMTLNKTHISTIFDRKT